MFGLRRLLSDNRAAKMAQRMDRPVGQNSVLPDGQAGQASSGYNARIKSLMPQGSTFNNGIPDNGLRTDRSIYRAPNFMKG